MDTHTPNDARGTFHTRASKLKTVRDPVAQTPPPAATAVE